MNARASIGPAGRPSGVDPAHWRAVLAARAEWHMALADRLVAALDRIDGDPDLEPSLAAAERHPAGRGAILPRRDEEGAQLRWGVVDLLDREECAGEVDEDDNPLSLNPRRQLLRLVRTEAGHD